MNKKRVCILYCVFLACMTVLCMRFFIIAQNGSQADTALAGQYTRRMDIAKRYGYVFDRDGRLAGTAFDGYILFVDPSAVEDINSAVSQLAKASGKEESYFSEKLFEGDPFTVASNDRLEADYCKSFVKYKEDDSGFMCHLLGYRNADGNGVSGVLNSYDRFLSDISGSAACVSAVYQADASGRVLAGTVPQIYDHGYSEKNGIYLTIDIPIQRAVEKICDTDMDMGAVVVQDISTRQILSVVSRPMYRSSQVAQHLTSTRGELLNRAFMGYTPGSVFKAVVAAAALENNAVGVDNTYECGGYIDILDERIRCHNISGHGELDMNGAFAQSCNPYFIDAGLAVGTECILDVAKSMGVGMYDSVNLVNVAKANLPENELDLPALTANTSVGQGSLLLTPLEVCSIISSCVTGYSKKPSLVLKLCNSGYDSVYVTDDPGTKILADETVQNLRRMFELCVSDGTGYRAASDTVTTAGKTATAQSGQIKNGKEVIHQWFAGYFPADDPKYAVCVLCDGNGEANGNPAAIFRKIAEAIYTMEQ